MFEHFDMGRDELIARELEHAKWLEVVLDRWALEDARGGEVVVELASYSTPLWDPPGFEHYLESLDLIVFVADGQPARFEANVLWRGRVSKVRPRVPVFVFVSRKPSSTDASVDRTLQALENAPSGVRVLGARVGTPEAAFEVLAEAVWLAL